MKNKEEFVDGIICSENSIVVCAMMADKLNIPMFYERDKQKKYGQKNKIEGDLEVMKKCKNLFYLTRFKK